MYLTVIIFCILTNIIVLTSLEFSIGSLDIMKNNFFWGEDNQVYGVFNLIIGNRNSVQGNFNIVIGNDKNLEGSLRFLKK